MRYSRAPRVAVAFSISRSRAGVGASRACRGVSRACRGAGGGGGARAGPAPPPRGGGGTHTVSKGSNTVSNELLHLGGGLSDEQPCTAYIDPAKSDP